MRKTVRPLRLPLNGRLFGKKAVLCTETLLIVFLIVCLPLHSRGSNAPVAREITVVSDYDHPPYIFRNGTGNLQGLFINEWSVREKKTGMDWNKPLSFITEGRVEKTTFILKPYSPQLF